MGFSGRRLGTRGLRVVAAFKPGKPVSSAKTVEVTQESGVVPRYRSAAIRILFQSPHTTRRETVGVFYPTPTGGVQSDDKNVQLSLRKL